MQAKKFTFSEEKFREAILYIAKKSKDDPRFGAVKLNKILYFADFAAYRRLGDPITGAEYQKLNEGPAPREMLRVRQSLCDAGYVSLVPIPYFNGVQHRLVIHIDFTPKILSGEETKILDEVIEELWNHSAREVSDLSHEELGWKLIDYGDTIPYETAWLGNDPVDQELEEYGQKLAKRYA